MLLSKEETHCYLYLTTPQGKLPRDMVKEEIPGNWLGVRSAKIKEMNGLYDVGCFHRWLRKGMVVMIPSTQVG